jgi:hypothetical protein
MRLSIPAITVFALFAGQVALAQPIPAENPHAAPAAKPPLGMHQPMQRLPMPKRPPVKRPALPPLPSAAQLQRMLPPEPPTEEAIKQRFSQQRAHLEETLERDRKAAEQYAKDFDRMQKFQAEQLAKIMASAEQRREAMLQRLNEHEQSMLERFRQMRSAQQPNMESKPEPATAE